jgi:hypothetical protein
MREPWVDALWVAVRAGCSQEASRVRNHGGWGEGAVAMAIEGLKVLKPELSATNR